MCAVTAAQLNVRFTSEGADRVKSDIGGVGDAVDNVGRSGSRLSGLFAGLGTALIVPMGLGLRAAMDLEQTMANVDAALGDISDNDLSALAAQFNEIATNSQFSAVEIGTVAEELAKAGVAREDLELTTQAVVNLSQATGDQLAPSLEAVTTATAIWSDGMVAAENVLTDFTEVADILTTVANNTRASLTDINAGMRSLAPAAARAGLSYNEAAAAIGFFVDNGLTGADAGVSLTRAMTELANPTSEATTMLNNLGITAYDAQGSFVGFPSLFNQLQTSMAGLTQQEQELVLSTIFGAEAIDVMGIAALTGGDALQTLTDATYESGTAAEQSAIRMDTLSAQFDTLMEGANTFLGSLVSGLIPGLRFFVDAGNAVIDMLMMIPAPIKTIIGAVAGLLAGFATIRAAITGFGALSSILGVGGGLGIGAAISSAIPIVLGLAAAAGVVYVAWRSNFLGLRTVVSSVVRSVTGFIGRFKDAWNGLAGTSDVMSQILGWGGQAAAIVEPINSVSRAMLALSDAVRGIGGGEIPFFNTLADGLDRAAGFVDRFKTAWDDLGPSDVMSQINAWGGVATEQMGNVERAMAAFDVASGGMLTRLREMTAIDWAMAIGDVALTIGGWTVGAAQDIGSAVRDWVTDTALPAVGSFIAEVPEVLVSIGRWLMQAGANLYDVVEPWIEAAVGAASGIVHSIPEVAVSVGAWVMQAGANLYDVVRPWIEAAVGAASGIIHSIPSVAVSIGSWVMQAGANLYDVVRPWIEAAVGAASGIVHSIPSVAVSVGSWVMQAGANLYDVVGPWIDAALSAVSGIPHLIESVSVRIGDWLVQDAPDLWGKVTEFVAQAWSTVSGGVVSLAEAVNVKIDNFIATVNSSALWAEVTASLDELWTVSDSTFASVKTKAGELGNDLGRKLVGWIFDGFSGGGGGEGNGLGGGSQTLDTTALGAVTAFAGEFVDGIITELTAQFTEKFDFDVPMPDLTWPTWEEVWALAPDWMKDFVGAIQNEMFGSDDGGIKSPLGTGSGTEQFLPPDLGPFRTSLLEAQTLSRDTASAMKAAFSTPIDTSGMTAGIQTTKSDLAGLAESARGAADGLKSAFSGSIDTSGITNAANEVKAALASLGGNAGLSGGAGLGKGIISITVDNSAALEAISAVSAALSNLGGGGLKGGGASSVTITADNTAAMLAIGNVTAGLFGMSTMTSIVTITGENSAAMQAIGDVSAGMFGINGLSSTVILVGDNGAAMQSIGDVSAGMYGIDGMTSTIYVVGDNSSAMAAINEVAAYNGVSLGSATFTVNTITTSSPAAVGAGIGAGVLRGWDQATGTRSPSTEMIKRGQYLFQGLDIGWTGSASNLPVGFDVASPGRVPTVPYQAGGGLGFGGVGGGPSTGRQVIVQKLEVNVPTTLEIDTSLSDEEILRIIRLNAKAQEQATLNALRAQGA